MQGAAVATASLLLVALTMCVSSATPAQQTVGGTIGFQFIGSGFHQLLELTVVLKGTPASKSAQMVTIDIDLPKAYFIDIAEAKQAYHSEGASLVNMSSEFLFDIEAPIFKIPYENNKVTTIVELPGTSTQFTITFPIHTRYEEVDVERPFDWAEFLAPIPSYINRCIEAKQVSGNIATNGIEGVQHLVPLDETPACVAFPRGIVAQLPVVYWLTMGLLMSGALLVIALVR